VVIAQLTTDNREPFREYGKTEPWFGAAPEALLEGFARISNVEVHVITCAQQEMAHSPSKLAPNVFFHSLYVPKIGWMRTGYQGCVRAIRRRLKEITPDIVHGQGTERECGIAAVFSGYPNIITIHGNMAELARIFKAPPLSFNWLAGKIEDFCLPRTEGVLCNSHYTESLVSPRARRCWRTPNAIRGLFLKPRTSSHRGQKVTILNVGVISPRKRQVELIHCLHQLHKSGHRFVLRFIGLVSIEEPYGTEFLELIQDPNIKSFVTHRDSAFGDELLDEYDAASALIHFPSEEAFGLVAAEALARNLKIFCANLGGLKDISQGVPEAELFGDDDWEALREGVCQWLTKGAPVPADAKSVALNRYSPQVVASRHLEIYSEVLNTRS
jgi:glycosyltransferase involved in cell wall biosynthesis